MKNVVAIMAIMLAAICAAGCQQQATEPDKAAIQGAMQSYIQTKLVVGGGTYDINGVKADFDYIHDGLNEDEGLFISCVDFKSGDDVFDVDYYVRDDDGELAVVKVVLHKKNGEVVNEVLTD